MEERRFPRVPVHCPVVFVGTRTVSKGTVTNCSVLGCTVESTTILRKGDHLELTLTLPETEVPIGVNLATVRWALGGKSGLEFVVVGLEERARIRAFINDQTEPLHPWRSPTAGQEMN